MIIEQGETYAEFLFGEFGFQVADSVELFVESVDGGIDAVEHGAAAVDDEVIDGAFLVHMV